MNKCNFKNGRIDYIEIFNLTQLKLWYWLPSKEPLRRCYLEAHWLSVLNVDYIYVRICLGTDGKVSGYDYAGLAGSIELGILARNYFV